MTTDRELLERMDGKMDRMAQDLAVVTVEMFGTGTTEGLVTKVDGLSNGHKVDAGKISVIVSAITGTLVLVVAKLTGMDLQ